MTTPVTPHLPPGERLRRAGVGAWSVIGILILVAISAWLLSKVRIIFPPLVLALLVIYLLNPLISRLVARGMPRPVAAIFVFVASISVAILIGIAVFPFISRQVTQFGQDWPEFRTKVVNYVQDTSHGIEDRFGIEIDTSKVSCLLGDAQQVDGEDCSAVTREIQQQVSAQTGRITAVGLTVLEGLVIFVLSPLLALYLLIDLPQLQRDALNLFPESHRDEAADLGSKIGRAVGGFFRGQLLVALTVGVLSAIGFKIVGLPFWALIGAIAGFFNLIPLVGPFIGGAVGFLVGTVSAGVGLGIKAAIVELIVQQLDNHIISPQVMRRTVQLHPATVVLALLAGGTIAGFWGVLLGVPVVAVGKILLGHVWTTRVLGAQATPFGTPRARGSPPSVVPGAPGEEASSARRNVPTAASSVPGPGPGGTDGEEETAASESPEVETDVPEADAKTDAPAEGSAKPH
jgi:predicted PurR-regulated permease PerM